MLVERTALTLFDEDGWQAVGAHLRLSDRELEIVRRVIVDDKDGVIAEALGMSVHTLRTHVQRLHDKLGVADRTQLVVRLFETYLVLVEAPGSALCPLCGRRSAGTCPANE